MFLSKTRCSVEITVTNEYGNIHTKNVHTMNKNVFDIRWIWLVVFALVVLDLIRACLRSSMNIAICSNDMSTMGSHIPIVCFVMEYARSRDWSFSIKQPFTRTAV